MVWLAWRAGYFPTGHRTDTTALLTNAPAPVVHQEPPLVSTTLVTRAVLPDPTTNVAGPPSNSPVPASVVLAAQIALDRMAFSPGSIDGVLGAQTRAALHAFQERELLPQTGQLDTLTRARLALDAPALIDYRVAGADLARLRPIASTWLGKSMQERLDYETLLELVAERSHAHPNLIRKLNPAVDWITAVPGTELIVPATRRDPPRAKAATIQIRLRDRALDVFDAGNHLIAHFPCSIAARVEKRPVGKLRVAVMAPNPDYTFNPELFPEAPEARDPGTKLKLPPGPNNPVGTAWIGLDRPGYGIHGTPRPEEVGRTESHGCFRLANWNAEYLLQVVTVGTPVEVEP